MASSNLSPFLEHPLVSITKVDKEIVSVVSLMPSAAAATIPSLKHEPKVKNYMCGKELKQKCQESKSAWSRWQNADQPRSSPLFQQMKTTRNEVKLHVRKYRAKQERITIQARDDMFRTKDEQQFNIHQRKTECRKLMVDGLPITDDDELWTC